MAINILRLGLPVIGHAKIGEPKPKSQERGHPSKFDHIELTTTVRDAEGALVLDRDLTQKILDAGGSTCGGCARSKKLGFPHGLPTSIPILLPFNDLELNLPHRLALYKGKTAVCYGDGETAERRNGQDLDGPYQSFGGCGKGCAYFKSGACKPEGKLRFVLPIQESVGGCYEFRTTSWNSIANVVESLKMVQTITGGILQWVPLVFEIAPQTVQPQRGEGGPANTAYIARVTFPGSPKQLLDAAREELRLRAPILAEIRKLEARVAGEEQWSETTEEEEAIVAEFFPESDAPAPETAPAPAPINGLSLGRATISGAQANGAAKAPRPTNGNGAAKSSPALRVVGATANPQAPEPAPLAPSAPAPSPSAEDAWGI